jgi:Xaa-Pro aminopeptidase
MDRRLRLARLRASFTGAGIEALLVTRLPNLRYLTGFTGSAGMLVVTERSARFVTDGRYRDQAADQLAAAGVAAEVAVGATAAEQRALVAEAVEGCRRLGLEAHGVTWATQRAWAEAWRPVELVPTEGLVEALRLTKDPAEIARVAAACAIADDALAEVLPRLAAGPTEREVALHLEVAMRQRGAEGMSFDPIVAAGPNGARPHARPSDRPIGRGELVVIDFGCTVDGYCSDTTRTVSVGDPGPEARALWDLVAEAQAAGRAALRAGVAAAEVDRACREVIAAAGWADAFVHSTGHGVGLEIHEDPRVAATSAATLPAGTVVTVEPGVYVPGLGGVRIEDTVAVGADGGQVLTHFPKDLML